MRDSYLSASRSGPKEFSSLPADIRILLDEKVHRQVLPNGMTLLYKEIPGSPVFSAHVYIRTGSIHEGPFLGCGVSHFVEHMCFKGTERRGFREITGEVQAAGGNSNANTGFERTVYFIDLPPEGYRIALDVLEDTVFHSRIPAEEFASEREVILREIAMVDDDPDWVLAIRLLENAFRVDPARYPIIGYKNLFESVSREDLAGYYRATYLPNRAVLAMAGPLPPDAVLGDAAGRFGGLPRGRFEERPLPAEPEQMGFRTARFDGDYELTRGALAIPVPGPGSLEFPAIRVLADVLGGGEASRLWTRLRNRDGLVEDIDASPFRLGSGALFWVSYLCEPDKEEAAEAAVIEEIARLVTDPPGKEEIATLKEKAIAGEVRARTRTSVEASRIGNAEAVLGDLDLPRVQFETLYRLNRDAVATAASRWLHPHRITAARLGPKRPARAAAQRDPLSATLVEETVLPGGVRLVECPDPRLPLFSLRATYRSGPVFDPEGKAGLGALFATMLTRDAGGRDAETIARDVEAVGGRFEETVGNNSAALGLGFQSRHLGQAVDTLRRALLAAEFRESTLARERSGQIAAVRERLDDPVAAGVRELRRVFYGSHPFREEAEGSPDSIASLSVDDLRRYREERLSVGNLVLVLSGRYDRAEAHKRLGHLSEELAQAGRTNSDGLAEAPFSGAASEGDHSVAVQREQAVVFQAYPIGGLLDEDFARAEVANGLLSGMASRLFEEVRERRGLAYFVSALRIIGLRQGCLSLFAGCRPDQVDAVRTEYQREMERLGGEGPGDAELASVIQRLRSAKRIGLESSAVKAAELGLHALYGLELDLGEEYCRRVGEVDREAVRSWFAERVLARNPLRLTMMGRGPGES